MNRDEWAAGRGRLGRIRPVAREERIVSQGSENARRAGIRARAHGIVAIVPVIGKSGL